MNSQNGNQLQRTLFKAYLAKSDAAFSQKDLELLCNALIGKWLENYGPQLRVMAGVAKSGLLHKRRPVKIVLTCINLKMKNLPPAWSDWFIKYPCIGDLLSHQDVLKAEFIARLEKLATLAEGL